METFDVIYLRLGSNSRVPVATRRKLAETLVRLPEKVCDFVLNKCYFYSLGEGLLGMAVRSREIGRWTIENKAGKFRVSHPWIILLSDQAVSSEEDGHGLIAHEVAHCWLGSRRAKRQLAQNHEEQRYQDELDASSLAAEWGFVGPSANPAEYPGDGQVLLEEVDVWEAEIRRKARDRSEWDDDEEDDAPDDYDGPDEDA